MSNMKNLLQIVYISRSTFTSSDSHSKIEPNVARILGKSRINNRKNGLVGVLYFGDGIFFQCLEGEEGAVNQLMDKLALDPRHQDLRIVSKKYVDKLSFADWAMKFAPIDSKIAGFLRANGFQRFDPYAFSEEVTRKFLDELFYADDLKDVTDDALLTRTLDAEAGLQSNTNKMALVALIFSGFALVISLFTFLSSKNLI